MPRQIHTLSIIGIGIVRVVLANQKLSSIVRSWSKAGPLVSGIMIVLIILGFQKMSLLMTMDWVMF